MNHRRIVPTLAVLLGVGGIGLLACVGAEPVTTSLAWLGQNNPEAILAQASSPPAVAIPAPAQCTTCSTGHCNECPDAPPQPVSAPNLLPVADARYGREPERLIPVPEPEEDLAANPANLFEQAPPFIEPGANSAAAAPEVNPVAAPEPEFASPELKAPGVTLPEVATAPAQTNDRYQDHPFAQRMAYEEPAQETAAPASAPQIAEPALVEPRAIEPVAQPIESAPQRPSSMKMNVIHAHDALPISSVNKQAGSVTLDWNLPTSITVGQPANCEMQVRNATDAAARHVIVALQLPPGVELVNAQPAAAPGAQGVLNWKLGELAPGAVTTIQLNLISRKEGEFSPRAAVTFTRITTASLRVVEPRLSLAIDGPTETVVGQPSGYQFRVTNQGTGPTQGVTLDVQLSAGLAPAPGGKSRYQLGTIGAGESRQVQVMISGAAEGDCSVAGQILMGEKALAKSQHATRVVRPELAVAVEGPKLRLVDRKASYVIKVQNPGPAAIDNVQLLENVPDGFRFVDATSGGNFDQGTRQVAWFVGRLEPNATASVAVQLLAVEAGDHRFNASAKADMGEMGKAETQTVVRGAPRVVIDVTEDDDPVEVEGQTVYHVRLTNAGSTVARKVQFAGEVPAEMEVIKLTGPGTGTTKERQIVFTPVDSLPAGETISYDVQVQCHRAGQVRFRAFFRSEDNPTPVLEEETTRIYAD